MLVERPDLAFLFICVCREQYNRSGEPSRIRCYGLNPSWLETEAGVNLYIIYAGSMCLAGKDVVYLFSVITAVDTVE